MYSPKINPELVKRLYRLKHSTEQKIPMTKLVNDAVSEYLERKVNSEQKEVLKNSSEDSGADN